MMKIKDVEHINELLRSLGVVKDLIAHVEHAETGDFEVFIERGGDGSIKLSEEGADSSHYQGYPSSEGFRATLKRLAIEELNTRKAGLEADLAALGVDTSE